MTDYSTTADLSSSSYNDIACFQNVAAQAPLGRLIDQLRGVRDYTFTSNIDRIDERNSVSGVISFVQ